MDVRDDGLLLVIGVDADVMPVPSDVDVEAVLIVILIEEDVVPGQFAVNCRLVVVVAEVFPPELVFRDIGLVRG